MKLALNVFMQNDGDFVDLILLYPLDAGEWSALCLGSIRRLGGP
jgi:hypothetical protein